jgi:hypothetical protein
MTPYNHYPRIGLQYCRCAHCGNTLRSMTLSRIFENRRKHTPYTPMPKYKQKRVGRLRLHPKLKATVRLRARVCPPYKQRREFKDRMRELLTNFGVKG